METEVQETDGRGDEKSGKSKRARPVKVKLVSVQVIHKEGEAALVQWTERGKLRRGIVPVSSVKDEVDVTADELAACLPYGDDWSQVAGVTPGVVKALKDYGIWTKQDALASPRHVREALVVGYVPVTAAALMEFVKEE